MDMMCSRCRKRPAVVFMSGMSGTQKFENGYCLKCAKELGIPQVDNYLKQMGISDIDFENASNMLFGNPDADNDEEDEEIAEDEIAEDEDDEDIEEIDEEDEDAVDGFKAGGTMPAFFQRFFDMSGRSQNEIPAS